MGRARYSIFKEQDHRRTGLPAKDKYTTMFLQSQGFFMQGIAFLQALWTFSEADKGTFFKALCQVFSMIQKIKP